MNEFIKTKSIDTSPAEVTDEELELIARYARKKPEADSVYTFSVILCDNDIDRDSDRFTTASLAVLAEMFRGVTGIFDHECSAGNQTARIYRTQVITDTSVRTKTGEDYAYLKAWCYMIRTKKNEDLIAEIEGGIKKEVSVSCAVNSVKCSVCGKDVYKQGCSHTAGTAADGKMCYHILDDPADAYEWSFVAVPAQRRAGVTKKAFASHDVPAPVESDDIADVVKALGNADGGVTLTKRQADMLAVRLNEAEGDSASVRRLKDSVLGEITAMAAVLFEKADTSVFAKLFSGASLEQLENIRDALKGKCVDSGAFEPKLTAKTAENTTDNSGFRI